MSKSELTANDQLALVEDLASYSKDPVGFVYYAFPWGTGELADFDGPDEWALDVLGCVGAGLLDINEAIKIAVASGHGVGKSCMVAWLILWAISTFEDTKGVVTANTDTQLKTKTWPEVAKWHRLFIAKDLFEITATSIYSKDPEHERTWRIDMIPWSKHNPEAFAGLHNKGKRILIIFDEASAIEDIIWEVMEGALSDSETEIIWCAFGNPTRNHGSFRECFRAFKHRWHHLQLDSRTVKITNKAKLEKEIEDHGIDSDRVKVRILGQFPDVSDLQFIPTSFVDAARKRVLRIEAYDFAPKIICVDPAYSGKDEFVVGMRQGNAFKILATYSKLQDDVRAAGLIARLEDDEKADAVFIDFGFGTGIHSAGKHMGRKWLMVQFGGKSSKPGFLNKRAEMWNDMKVWLKDGGALPPDQTLCDEICAPEYYVKLSGEIVIESKEDMADRGVPSPNRADALAISFAFPVRKKEHPNYSRPEFANTGKLEFSNQEYDPLA